MPLSISFNTISHRAERVVRTNTSGFFSWNGPLIFGSVAAMLCLLSSAAMGQMPLPSPSTTDIEMGADSSRTPAQATQSQSSGVAASIFGDSTNTEEEQRPIFASANPSGTEVLSADQIINILQQNPDITTELKSLAAERMQEQGTQLDPNNISDEMLYQQISTSENLRASITTFLQARGFVAESGAQPTSDIARSMTGTTRIFCRLPNSPRRCRLYCNRRADATQFVSIRFRRE